ncbi:Epoxide hydrolase 4 [Homalodisca vitripennis]|nr:Epoxide hydrolase 4 [Homalodisca vitripennis]
MPFDPLAEPHKASGGSEKNREGALTPPINYYRATITPDRELLRRRAENFKMPRGLFVFGEDDSAINIEVVEKTRRMVHNLTTEVIKGASHFVQQDDPEAVNKVMREFLKSGYEEERLSREEYIGRSSRAADGLCVFTVREGGILAGPNLHAREYGGCEATTWPFSRKHYLLICL